MEEGSRLVMKEYYEIKPIYRWFQADIGNSPQGRQNTSWAARCLWRFFQCFMSLGPSIFRIKMDDETIVTAQQIKCTSQDLIWHIRITLQPGE